MKKQKTTSQGNRSEESKQHMSKVRNKAFQVVEIFSIKKKFCFTNTTFQITMNLKLYLKASLFMKWGRALDKVGRYEKEIFR